LNGKVSLVPLKEKGITGNFIVTVLETGQVLYSAQKRMVPITEEEQIAVVEKIKELLSKA